MTDANQLATGFNVPEDHMYHKGLTKREYFAAMALQGLLSRTGDYTINIPSDTVYDAVDFADRLIEQLNQVKK